MSWDAWGSPPSAPPLFSSLAEGLVLELAGTALLGISGKLHSPAGFRRSCWALSRGRVGDGRGVGIWTGEPGGFGPLRAAVWDGLLVTLSCGLGCFEGVCACVLRGPAGMGRGRELHTPKQSTWTSDSTEKVLPGRVLSLLCPRAPMGRWMFALSLCPPWVGVCPVPCGWAVSSQGHRGGCCLWCSVGGTCSAPGGFTLVTPTSCHRGGYQLLFRLPPLWGWGCWATSDSAWGTM